MKKKYIFITFVLSIIFMLVIQYNVVFADVGSFESYDSGGSSWSSSDWGSSSSWDSDYSWSSSSSSSDGGDLPVGVLLAMSVIIIVAVLIQKNQRGTIYPRNYQQQSKPQEVVVNDTFTEKRIKEIDPLFNKEEFLSFAKTLFVKLQEAWTARDWSTIRTYETNELFEQHQKQLQGYIDRKQINVMERICVKSAYLSGFTQSGDKDILTIVLNSKMIDYIIDETTGKITQGDKTTERHSSYKMTFIRNTGIKTQEGTGEVKTTNCPNCGAPTEITSSGKCEYCGSVITTDEHNWALSNLEKIG